jgi:Gpi18-like mannosyltransferase
MSRFPTFLWLYAGIASSLLLRASVLDFESSDYKLFLSGWYDYFVRHGRWTALKDDFSSYPPLYLYLLSLSTLLPLPKLHAIKLISISCDYLAAWIAFKIVRYRFQRGTLPWASALSVLFLPTVWFNSAVWGQCDVMFTATLLGTLHYLLIRRPLAAMIAFGFACSLKPQAIFFVPFLGGVFFRERWPWKCLLIPTLIYTVCGLPAVLAGKPILELLFHWGRQRNYARLTLGATNWYQWISNEHYQVVCLCGIVLTILATAFLILAMQQQTSTEHGAWLVTTALLSVLVVPYFLPGMHERYFYAADLFSVVYSFFVARGWMVAALVQFCSFFTYLPYLFQIEPVPRPLLAGVMTLAIGFVVSDYWNSLFESKSMNGKFSERKL